MRNQFVYDTINELALSQPDIDVEAVQHFAQCAEDIIVLSLLRGIAQRRNIDLSLSKYLEIGANHPIATNATYLLQREAGMSGILVEGNPALIPELKKVRYNDVILNKAVTATYVNDVELYISNQSELSSLSKHFVESWQEGRVGIKEVSRIPAIQINEIFENYFTHETPIYMSIDVEGMDLELLEALDWSRWRPAIVQAEPSEHFIQENGSQITDFMSSVDYVLIAKTNVNLIFIDKAALFENAVALDAGVKRPPTNASGDRLRPSIGVVTRTKDRAVLLRRALESVKKQTYDNWRLVVVRGGSVCLNSFGLFVKWISASIMLPPSLVPAR